MAFFRCENASSRSFSFLVVTVTSFELLLLGILLAERTICARIVIVETEENQNSNKGGYDERLGVEEKRQQVVEERRQQVVEDRRQHAVEERGEEKEHRPEEADTRVSPHWEDEEEKEIEKTEPDEIGNTASRTRRTASSRRVSDSMDAERTNTDTEAQDNKKFTNEDVGTGENEVTDVDTDENVATLHKNSTTPTDGESKQPKHKEPPPNPELFILIIFGLALYAAVHSVIRHFFCRECGSSARVGVSQAPAEFSIAESTAVEGFPSSMTSFSMGPGSSSPVGVETRKRSPFKKKHRRTLNHNGGGRVAPAERRVAPAEESNFAGTEEKENLERLRKYAFDQNPCWKPQENCTSQEIEPGEKISGITLITEQQHERPHHEQQRWHDVEQHEQQRWHDVEQQQQRWHDVEQQQHEQQRAHYSDEQEEQLSSDNGYSGSIEIMPTIVEDSEEEKSWIKQFLAWSSPGASRSSLQARSFDEKAETEWWKHRMESP